MPTVTRTRLSPLKCLQVTCTRGEKIQFRFDCATVRAAYCPEISDLNLNLHPAARARISFRSADLQAGGHVLPKRRGHEDKARRPVANTFSSLGRTFFTVHS